VGEKNFSCHWLRLATLMVEELDMFGPSLGVVASIMAASWSKYSVTAFMPDTGVQIVSSEQLALIAQVLDIAIETCQFCSDSLKCTTI
jgi:hypothetical protein